MDNEKILKNLNKRYKQSGGGGIPFSAFQKKIKKLSKNNKTINKKKKKSHSRKKKKKHQTLRFKKCPCGDHKYTGKEKTPKGLGFCEQCIPLNVVIKGKDGNLYENKNYQWIKL